MERTVLGLFRLGVLIGIFAWFMTALQLSHSLQSYLDRILTGFS
jgi:hypothetical protein